MFGLFRLECLAKYGGGLSRERGLKPRPRKPALALQFAYLSAGTVTSGYTRTREVPSYQEPSLSQWFKNGDGLSFPRGTTVNGSGLLKELWKGFLIVLVLPTICSAQLTMRSGASGSISGKVVFAASNRPAERVRVDLILPTGAWAANGYTNWNGEFDFDALPPGDYRVVVDQPGYERVEENVDMDFASRSVQLRLNEVRPQVNGEIGSAVSVRELSIPVKAREAFKNGLMLLAKQDTPGALKSFEQAVKRFPGYYEAYHQIGMAYLELGHREDAEQAFKRSIELSSGRYAPAQIALGAVFCDRGKFIEAERSIREGLELDDAPWLSHYVLAKALFGLGRWDEAERSIHEVIARKSDLPESYLLLSGIHFNQDNYVALLDDLDDYLRLDGESSTAAEVRTLREKVKLALAQENHAAASLTR